MSSETSIKSYRKALFLTVFLVLFLVFFIAFLKLLGSPSHPINKVLFGMQVPNGVPFREYELDAARKRLTGFWQSVNAVNAEIPFARETDKLEIKPNGIYWRVQFFTINLPSGDSVCFSMVSTGFLNPYYHSIASPESLTCQVHFIGEAVVAAKDTCYVEFTRVDPSQSLLPQLQYKPKPGEGVVDTIWDFVANDKRLGFSNRKYTAFDTAGTAFSSFFPEGITSLVNKISLEKCSRDMSFELLAKHALTADLAQLSVPGRSQQDILAVVDRYYKTMFAVKLAKRITAFKKGTMTVTFGVTPLGKVIEPKIVKAKPWNMKLNKAIKMELLTWVFPLCSSQDAPVKVSFSFTY